MFPEGPVALDDGVSSSSRSPGARSAGRPRRPDRRRRRLRRRAERRRLRAGRRRLRLQQRRPSWDEAWAGPSPGRAAHLTGGSIQRVDLDTGAVTTLYTESSFSGRSGRPTTSSSTPTAASGSPTTACGSSAQRPHRPPLRQGRRLELRGGHLPPGRAQRRRPLARRHRPLRRRDPHRPRLRWSLAGPGESCASTRWATAAACSPASPGCSCSTASPSTARAGSASPPSSTAASPTSAPTARRSSTSHGRPAHHQHLLRRARPAHRLLHPVGHRRAGHLQWPRPGLRLHPARRFAAA